MGFFNTNAAWILQWRQAKHQVLWDLPPWSCPAGSSHPIPSSYLLQHKYKAIKLSHIQVFFFHPSFGITVLSRWLSNSQPESTVSVGRGVHFLVLEGTYLAVEGDALRPSNIYILQVCVFACQSSPAQIPFYTLLLPPNSTSVTLFLCLLSLVSHSKINAKYKVPDLKVVDGLPIRKWWKMHFTGERKDGLHSVRKAMWQWVLRFPVLKRDKAGKIEVTMGQRQVCFLGPWLNHLEKIKNKIFLGKHEKKVFLCQILGIIILKNHQLWITIICKVSHTFVSKFGRFKNINT